MRYRYSYHCVRCKCLIAADNKPLNIPAICMICQQKDTDEMVKRRNEKINIDVEYRAKQKEYCRMRAEKRKVKK